MATDKLRWAGARHGGGGRKHQFGSRPEGRVPVRAAVVLFSLFFLAWCATVSAQDEGILAPTPIPGAPTEDMLAPTPVPGPPTMTPPAFEEEELEEEVEEEEVGEERRVLPFLLEQPSLTETLMPDASPDLNSAVLFPPDALGGLPRAGRGLLIGRFAVSSSIAAAAAYDDNVTASENDREDDITGNLGGSVSAESQFERHSLGFGAAASIGNPHDNINQDTLDRFSLRTGVDGRLDLTRRSSLSAEANLARGAQNPEAQEAGAEDQPTIYTASTAVAYSQSFNRLSWQLAGGANRREADDGEQAAEQDRTTYTVSPGVNYQISRRLSLFADTGYSLNQYDQSGEGGSRDSQSVGASVGANVGLGRTFAARIGVGYAGVFFDDSERDDKHVPTITAGLDGAIGISLDRLTVLRLSVNHSTDQTTAEEAALVTRTGVAASVNRPLTRASAILARVDANRSDFVDDDRTDHDIGAELAYSHILVRNIALNLAYRFSKRFSDADESDFYRNIVSVGLSASF